MKIAGGIGLGDTALAIIEFRKPCIGQEVHRQPLFPPPEQMMTAGRETLQQSSVCEQISCSNQICYDDLGDSLGRVWPELRHGSETLEDMKFQWLRT
jgi:hypothetical protein